MFQDENGGSSWCLWPPRPNTALLLFQASTQSPSLKTGTPRALQLGNVKTMVQWKTTQQETGRSRWHQPPATCEDSWTQPGKGKGPRFEDPTVSDSIPWPAGEDHTRGLEERSEAAWGRDGYCGVMSCSLELGVMALSALVKRCRSVRLKKKKNQFYDVYVYLNMQKPMPKAHKKKSLKSEVRFPLSALGSAGEIAPSTVGQSLGGQVIPKAEERKGKQGPELLPAGPRLLPSMRSEPWWAGRV